jgi:hypothetical protein
MQSKAWYFFMPKRKTLLWEGKTGVVIIVCSMNYRVRLSREYEFNWGYDFEAIFATTKLLQ